MEERNSEKASKYHPPFVSQSNLLQSEIVMLEERLQNLEYLKKTYERSFHDKNSEIEALSQESGELRHQLLSKTHQIQELTQLHASKEATLLKVIEEHRMNKSLLEEEISQKNFQMAMLEKKFQQLEEENSRMTEEHEKLKIESKSKEELYISHISMLEEKLKEITATQIKTEERVNNILMSATPKKKFGRIRRENGCGKAVAKQDRVGVGKSSKNLMVGLYKQKGIEERLLSSEKKIREIEEILVSSNPIGSPMYSINNVDKLRSSSLGIKLRTKY